MKNVIPSSRYMNCLSDALDMEEPLTSPTLDVETKRSTKREGNGNSEQTVPTHAKPSRRTTSLLNLFMSNSQGTLRTTQGLMAFIF